MTLGTSCKRNVFGVCSCICLAGLILCGALAYTESIVKTSANLRLCDRLDRGLAKQVRCQLRVLNELSLVDTTCRHTCDDALAQEHVKRPLRPRTSNPTETFTSRIFGVQTDEPVVETCTVRPQGKGVFHDRLLKLDFGIGVAECFCGTTPFQVDITYNLSATARKVANTCTRVTTPETLPIPEVDCVYLPLHEQAEAELLVETSVKAERAKCEQAQQGLRIDTSKSITVNGMVALLMSWCFVVSCLGSLEQHFKSSRSIATEDPDRFAMVPGGFLAADAPLTAEASQSGDFHRMDKV